MQGRFFFNFMCFHFVCVPRNDAAMDFCGNFSFGGGVMILIEWNVAILIATGSWKLRLRSNESDSFMLEKLKVLYSQNQPENALHKNLTVFI